MFSKRKAPLAPYLLHGVVTRWVPEKQVAESILVSAKVYLFIFFTNNIYCNIFSKSLKGSFRELSLFTFEYLKDTNARQDRTHTHKKATE